MTTLSAAPKAGSSAGRADAACPSGGPPFVGILRARIGCPGQQRRRCAMTVAAGATVATGAQVEVVLVADQEPGAIWDLITDVARIGEWSPECVGGRWLDG